MRLYPKAGPRLSSMKRKKGKTRILTDTPEKRLIEIAEQEKQRKNKAKEERQFKKNLKNTEKKKNPKLPVELTSKRAVEKEMISSDSDMENVFIAASSEGSFVIETSEEELDEDDVIILDRNFKINDFVLVKFDTKKLLYIMSA